MRIHGLLLHNFCRYGEDKNVIEFDNDAGWFFKHGKNITGWLNVDVIKEACERLEFWGLSEPRIISIVGQTEGDPALSNGTGKSTVLEGISYALFEKLTRDFVHKASNKGSSTNSIIPDDRDVQESYVELLFSAQEELWLLIRGRKVIKSGHSPILFLRCLSNSELDKKCCGHRAVDTDNYVASLVRIDFNAFCNSIMFGINDAGKFLVGTDKEKKDILISVLQLDVITDYLDEIRKKRKKKCNEEILSCSSQIGLLSDQLDSLGTTDNAKKQIASLDKQIVEQDEHVKTVEKLLEFLRKSSAQMEHDDLKKKIALIESLIEQIDQKFNDRRCDLKTKFEDASSLLKGLEDSVVDLKEVKNRTQSRIERLQKDITNFDPEVHSKEVTMVEMAFNVRPERKKELEAFRELQSSLRASFKLSKSKAKEEEQKAESLDQMLKKADDKSSIFCPECESIVTASHIQSKIDEHKELSGKHLEEATEQTKQDEDLQTKIDDLERRMKNIDEYIAKEPVLRSILDKSVSDKVSLEEQKTDLTKYEKSIADGEGKAPPIRKQIEEAKSALASIDEDKKKEVEPEQVELEKSQEYLKTVFAKKEESDRKVIEAEGRKDKCVKEKEQLLSSKARVEAQLETIDKTGKKLKTLQDKLAEEKITMDRLKYLENLFGPNGIQVQLIHKYLPLLNKYINEYANIISDIIVDITADIGETDKVNMSFTGNQSNRLEGLSMGEFAKVRLATNIALGLLSFVRRKDVPEFICLDEIFAPLDVHSKDLVFVMLDQLQQRFRDIIVISHHPAVVDRIKDMIVVNKVNGLSTIEKND